MSVREPANSLPTDHTGGSRFLLEAQAMLPMPKALALRQAFEPVVFAGQQNSHYIMAPLPDAAQKAFQAPSAMS